MVDCGVVLGIEDRAGVVVERRRAVEIVLADRGLDRTDIEVTQTGTNTRVGLGRLPAAALALVTQLVHRRPAELPQVGWVVPRCRRVPVQAGNPVDDALIVDLDRGAMRQLADGAGRPVEAGLDHRFQDAALARADGLGQRAVLQLL